MLADEARDKSITPQYEAAKEQIRKATERGRVSTTLTFELLSEVIVMLTDEGYNITILHCKWSEISWKEAVKGKVGVITKEYIE